jgi:phosphoribosylformimino-5-aminoimidazole carboxamide ribonucleotide (ProFAR) isomerase
MSSITIHNLDNDLERVIRETAESQHTSLNKVIKKVLRESFGLDTKRKKKSDFSEFVETWSEAEAMEFENNIQEFETIDSEMWK